MATAGQGQPVPTNQPAQPATNGQSTTNGQPAQSATTSQTAGQALNVNVPASNNTLIDRVSLRDSTADLKFSISKKEFQITEEDLKPTLDELLDEGSTFVLGGSGLKDVIEEDDCRKKKWWDCLDDSNTCRWSDGQCAEKNEEDDEQTNFDVTRLLFAPFYSPEKRPKALDELKLNATRREAVVFSLRKLMMKWAVQCAADEECRPRPSRRLMADSSVAKILRSYKLLQEQQQATS
jgi:hypothetical protein